MQKDFFDSIDPNRTLDASLRNFLDAHAAKYAGCLTTPAPDGPVRIRTSPALLTKRLSIDGDAENFQNHFA
jgi:hypothetical protein